MNRRVGCLLLFLAVILYAEPDAWRQLALPHIGHKLSGVTFLDDSAGWVWTDGSQLFRTVDGGASWKRAGDFPGDKIEVVRVWFGNESSGWAAGVVSRRPAVWKTTDGGESWTIGHIWKAADPSQPDGAMLDVHFTDPLRGWVAGRDGGKAAIFSTDDGGRSWRTQYAGREISFQFNKLRFDGKVGWALSPNGILRTDDRGENWRLEYFDDTGLLNDFSVAGENIWLAGAWSSAIRGDRRLRWGRVVVGPDDRETFLSGVHFIDEQRGWVIGVRGAIFETRDGGKIWNDISLPESLWNPEMSLESIGSTPSQVLVLARPGAIFVRPIRR